MTHSGTRCKKHNADPAVGGAPRSFHLKGMAWDGEVKNVPVWKVAQYCDKLIGVKGGLITYKSFVHVDVRGYKYRAAHTE